MTSKAAKPEDKAGWTTSARNTRDWAAGAASNASSNVVSSARTALTKLTNEDLLDAAKKPEVKAFVKAAVGGNLHGVVKSGGNITLKYLAPGLAKHRIVVGSLTGAGLGGCCGLQGAAIGGVAGGLYGHFKKPQEAEESGLEESDNKGNEKQNTSEEESGLEESDNNGYEKQNTTGYKMVSKL